MSFNSDGEYVGHTSEDDVTESSHEYIENQRVVGTKGFREGQLGRVVIPHCMVRVKWDNPQLDDSWATPDEIEAI